MNPFRDRSHWKCAKYNKRVHQKLIIAYIRAVRRMMVSPYIHHFWYKISLWTWSSSNHSISQCQATNMLWCLAASCSARRTRKQVPNSVLRMNTHAKTILVGILRLELPEKVAHWNWIFFVWMGDVQLVRLPGTLTHALMLRISNMPYVSQIFLSSRTILDLIHKCLSPCRMFRLPMIDVPNRDAWVSWSILWMISEIILSEYCVQWVQMIP